MAMSGTVLGDAIYSAIQALSSNQKTNPQAIWEAIGAAIVAHIDSNAVVTVTGTATGAMAGGPGVPVSGTGTIS